MSTIINTPDFFYAYKEFYGKPKITYYHYHNTCEIYFLVEGQCEFFLNDKTYLITENTILFIPSEYVHKNLYNFGDCKRIVINMSDTFLNPNIMPSVNKIFEQQIFVPEDYAYVKRLLMSIGAEYNRKDFLSVELIKAYLVELFAYFARTKSPGSIITTSNPSIERLIKHINTNFNQQISLENVAKMLNLTPPYLSRLFLKTTGFNFKEYLLTIRIKNAKHMLKNTNKSIRQVAYDCGFNDSNYFSKVFKEVVGISPLQYKRQD